MATFREKLLSSLRFITRAVRKEGVIVGSEVPNLYLLARNLRARGLFVSEDIDVAVFTKTAAARLKNIPSWTPSLDEPSVLVPDDPTKNLEINLLGIDKNLHLEEAKINDRAGFVSFGTLNLIQKTHLKIDRLNIPVATLPSLAIEKLTSTRSGLKASRDIYVALMAIRLLNKEELILLRNDISRLPGEFRYQSLSGIAILHTQIQRGEIRKRKDDFDRLHTLNDEWELYRNE